MKVLLPLIVAFTSVPIVGPQTAAPVGGAGMATIQQSSDPDTPTGDATEPQLRAWANRYIQKGSFVETGPFMHTDPANRIWLYDPTSLQKLPNGNVRAWFRIELFRAVVMHGGIRRSVRKQLEIDCSNLRYRELIIEEFAGANMQQRAPDPDFSREFGKPEPETSPQGLTARSICNSANAQR